MTSNLEILVHERLLNPSVRGIGLKKGERSYRRQRIVLVVMCDPGLSGRNDIQAFGGGDHEEAPCQGRRAVGDKGLNFTLCQLMKNPDQRRVIYLEAVREGDLDGCFGGSRSRHETA